MFSTCHYHYNKRLSHFCPSHDEVVCDKCLPESHIGCRNIQTIEKAVDTAKFGPALTNLESRIRHLSEGLTDVLRRNVENHSTLNNQKQSIRKKIKDIRKNINAHLDKVEMDLGNDLMTKYNSCANEIEKERQNLTRLKNTLEEWTREIKVMKDHASSIHLFSMAKLLSPRQKASENMVQKHLANTKTSNLDFESSKIVQDLKTLVLSYGKISLKDTPSYMTAEQRKKMAIPMSINAKSSFPTVSKFETYVFGTSVDAIRGCFLPDDRLLIPDSNTKTLFVCRIDGSNVKKIKLRYKPRDVCLMDEPRALVTCGDNGVMVIDIRTLSPGSLIEPCGHCSAVTSADDKIFVVNGECKISVIDMKGKFIKHYSTRYDPYMIAASKSGILYWTNYNNNSVNCIQPNGTNQNVYNGSDLRESTGIAVDNRNNVFGAGCDSSNIVKISRTDKSNKTLYGKRDGVNSPLGIALNGDKSKIMVINNYKQITVYKAHAN